MRKPIACLLLALLVFFSLATPAFATDIRVLVNGEQLALDVPPLIENSRTLVPVRAIAEKLGATVDWDINTRRVDIRLDNRSLVLFIDNATAYVDGAAKTLDVPARIVNGRTLVPARFISESLSAQVDWDPQTRVVTITTQQNVMPTLATLEAEVLNELNAARAQLSLPPLRLAGELSQMARNHAADLAGGGFFGHQSPSHGSMVERATAQGVRVNREYLATGLPDAKAIANAFLDSADGSTLLTQEASFIGLGLYQAAGSGNTGIFAVAELVTGDGLLLGARQRQLTGLTLTVSGYAQDNAPLTIYLLNDSGEYTSRQSINLSPNAASGSFSVTVNLWQQGHFRIMLGQDSIMVDNR